MRYYSIPICFYPSLTIGVSRRLTAVDKRRFQVRLFPVSRLDSPAWVWLACLPSHTPGRLPGAQTRAFARDTQTIIAP